MTPSDQNPSNQELVRRALAPPPSASTPPASTKPPASKATSSKPNSSKPNSSKTSVSKVPSRKITTSKDSNTPLLTSKIIEWDDQKGFGFLRHEKGKLFLHRKDFSERHKRPTKGDKIHYRVGSDPIGRRCAVEARHKNDGGKISLFTLLTIFILALIPALAWSHLILTNNYNVFLLLIPLAVNVLTYDVYKHDKELARARAWRRSEASLHFLELLGGWPAALIAQRQFRHKCSKLSFQISYWLIVVFHIGLAIDYFFNWEIVKIILGLLRQIPS